MNRSSAYNQITESQKQIIIELALSEEKINISAQARLMGINRKTFYSIYKSKTTIYRKRKHQQAEHEIVEQIGHSRLNEISKSELRKEVDMYGAQYKLKHPEFKKSKNWAAGFVKLLWAQRESDNEDLSRSQTPSNKITTIEEESTDLFREPELFNTKLQQEDVFCYLNLGGSNIYNFEISSQGSKKLPNGSSLESQDSFMLLHEEDWA